MDGKFSEISPHPFLRAADHAASRCGCGMNTSRPHSIGCTGIVRAGDQRDSESPSAEHGDAS